MNPVYAVVANHKKVTRDGIIHATNLPPDQVDEMISELIENNLIKMNKSYTEDGWKVNIPVYMPVKKFIQSEMEFPC